MQASPTEEVIEVRNDTETVPAGGYAVVRVYAVPH